MEILRAQAGAYAASVLQFLEYSTAKENMGETVFVLSYTDDFSMSNAVFEQVAETFEASALYNGPPFRAAQIVRGDGGVQDEVAAARGVEQNLVQIWKRGSLKAETKQGSGQHKQALCDPAWVSAILLPLRSDHEMPPEAKDLRVQWRDTRSR